MIAILDKLIIIEVLAYQKQEPKTPQEIKKALKKYPYPQGFKLPKGSDIATIEK